MVSVIRPVGLQLGLTQADFPVSPLRVLQNLFPFLGLLKHILPRSTLYSEAKAIHYSMPQSTGCLCNRIARPKQV